MNLSGIIAVVLCLFLGTPGFGAQIQAGKSIKVTISGVPDRDRAEITGLYPVAETATINMPHIGEIRAAGMGTAQLQVALQEHYKQKGIFTNPTIQVIDTTIVDGVSHETVMVGGHVKNSGPVPFAAQLTLWGAVQAAGGATEFGSMHRVKLLREGKIRTLDATRAEIMQIPLQRDDSIEVPQKGWTGR